MKLNFFTKGLSIVGRWIATTLFCLAAFTFVWQGTYFLNTSALASGNQILIASSQEAANETKSNSKSFVENTKDFVKDAARSNASKVDNATDDDNPIAGKAQRDAGRIQQRAEEDAARTEKAIDKNVNAVQRTVENIKDAFSN
jgi:uncharacterized protein YjbJ (UPF0337 family)